MGEVFSLKPPQCLNHAKEAVDWWFIIKPNGSMKNVYYDSKMARENKSGKHVFSPMNPMLLLDDEATSPILHTLYTPFDEDEYENASAPVFIAVNDQPAHDLDAFKKSVSTHSGHVKFFTSAQVELGKNPTKDDATIYSYLIQHSLPKFPNVEFSEEGTHRTWSFLKKELTGAYSQVNFLRIEVISSQPTPPLKDSISFALLSRKVESGVYRHQLRYRKAELPTYLQSRNHSFVSILHYLKVVNAAVVATNYDPFERKMRVFHQYLNVYEKWSPNLTTSQQNKKNLNMARTWAKDRTVNVDSDHLCPMWPINRQVGLSPDGLPSRLIKKKGDELFTMRSSGGPSTDICAKWSMEEPDDNVCLASASLRTTRNQYPLDLTILMKASAVELNIYDDLIAPMAVVKSDYAKAEDGDVSKAEMELGLIVQSWTDRATLPKLEVSLLPSASPLQVNLSIESSTSISLPTKTNWKIVMNSVGTDHSKWALLVPRGIAGTFPNLFCTCDLNRSYIQDERGGGAICTSNIVFTELMLALEPTVHVPRVAEFSNLEHLYAGMEQTLATAVTCAANKHDFCSAFFLASQRSHQVAIHRLPYPFDEPLKGVGIPVVKPIDSAPEAEDDMIIGDVFCMDNETFEKTAAKKDFADLYSKTMSQFTTGPLFPDVDLVMETTSKRSLEVSVPFWSHVLQAFHIGDGKSLSSFRSWLKSQIEAWASR